MVQDRHIGAITDTLCTSKKDCKGQVCTMGGEVQVLKGPIARSQLLEDPEQIPWCGGSGSSRGLTQIQIRGPSQCGPPTSNGRQTMGGERVHKGGGVAHSEVHSQEKGGAVVRAPNTSLSRDVQDVQGGVIGHKGTHVVRRPDPATQTRQEEVSRDAEDLGEDRLPEGPIRS